MGKVKDQTGKLGDTAQRVFDEKQWEVSIRRAHKQLLGMLDLLRMSAKSTRRLSALELSALNTILSRRADRRKSEKGLL